MMSLKIKLLLCVFVFIQPHLFSQNVRQQNDQNLRRTAEAFERVGQYQNAADYYSRAVRVNPKDVAAYLGAKRTLDKLLAYDQLEQLILELEATHRDLRYRVDLAWILYKRGDESGAKKAWKTIIAENSKRQETYSLIGLVYVENQQYDEAIDLYLDGRKNIKNNLAFMFEVANIYKILNEQEKIVDEYIRYLQVYPQQIDFLSAELQRFVQEQADSRPLLKTLHKELKTSGSPHWAIHRFLSDTYTIQKDYENALLHCVELERMLATSDLQKQIRTYIKGKYLYEFALTALSANAVDYAERAFVAIINEFGDSRYVTSAKLGLAKVYTNQQQYEKALGALQLFVDQNKRSADARLALLQMGDIAYHQLFDIERAEKAYTRALKEYPEVNFQIEALFRLADCATARADLETAEKHLTRVLEISTPNPALKGAGFMHLAWLEFYRMQPTASLSYLDEFSNVVFPSKQANVFENDAIELSMLLQENQYDSTGLAHLGKASLLIKQRQYQQAKELLENYLQENSNSQLRSELRLRLVDVYKMLKEFEPAIQVLESVYTDSTSFYRDSALLVSAEIYENELAAPVLAQERYEKILVEFPMSIYLETARERVRKLEN